MKRLKTKEDHAEFLRDCFNQFMYNWFYQNGDGMLNENKHIFEYEPNHSIVIIPSVKFDKKKLDEWMQYINELSTSKIITLFYMDDLQNKWDICLSYFMQITECSDERSCVDIESCNMLFPPSDIQKKTFIENNSIYGWKLMNKKCSSICATFCGEIYLMINYNYYINDDGKSVLEIYDPIHKKFSVVFNGVGTILDYLTDKLKPKIVNIHKDNRFPFNDCNYLNEFKVTRTEINFYSVSVSGEMERCSCFGEEKCYFNLRETIYQK